MKIKALLPTIENIMFGNFLEDFYFRNSERLFFLGFFCKHGEEMIHKDGEITIPYTTSGFGIHVVPVRVNVKLVTAGFK